MLLNIMKLIKLVKNNNIFNKKEYPIFSEETHSKKEKVFDILKEHFDKFNPTFN